MRKNILISKEKNKTNKDDGDGVLGHIFLLEEGVCVCQRCISAIFKCGPTHPWLQTAPLGPGATLSYAPALSPFFRRNKCGHFFSKQQRKLPNDVT